jgi:hypothetical protein
MVLSLDKSTRPFEAMLDDPDIKDMFAFDYPVGEKGASRRTSISIPDAPLVSPLPPSMQLPQGLSPEARYLPLFRKMYGDCRASSQVQQDHRMSSPGCSARLPERTARARTASASPDQLRPIFENASCRSDTTCRPR